MEKEIDYDKIILDALQKHGPCGDMLIYQVLYEYGCSPTEFRQRIDALIAKGRIKELNDRGLEYVPQTK